MYNSKSTSRKTCWNKGKLVGQKLPLKLEEIWSIRIRLELANNLRELTMFNLALDCKLRACDFIKLKVLDIAHGVLLFSPEPCLFNRKQVVRFNLNYPLKLESHCKNG